MQVQQYAHASVPLVAADAAVAAIFTHETVLKGGIALSMSKHVVYTPRPCWDNSGVHEETSCILPCPLRLVLVGWTETGSNMVKARTLPEFSLGHWK